MTFVDVDDIFDPAVRSARYLHPERHLLVAKSQLPDDQRQGLAAGLAGTETAVHQAISDRIRDLVDETAAALLQEPELADAVARLPLSGTDVVVALGDSITDDGCSWAELLRLILARTTGTTLVNAGVAGDSTSQAIARTDLLAVHRPTWVIQLLGTNDTRRHGHQTQARTVSLGETLRNYRLLDRIVTDDLGARLLRLTPPPVLDERASTWAPARAAQISWRAADLEELAHQVTVLDPGCIDVHAGLGGNRLGEWLHPDGVHPNFPGQQQILRTLVIEWAKLAARLGASR